MPEAEFFSWDGSDLILRVHVQTRAAKTEINGVFAGALKIRINSPPIDGKVNAELIKYLAQCFQVSKSHIELLSGIKNRNKRFRIKQPSVAPEEVVTID